MKLSIIIPVYNEETTVAEVIDKTKKLELGMEKEIIAVDDGSSDSSYTIMRDIPGIKVLRHLINQGKGAAVKTAIKNLTGDYFIIQDADLELEPGEISKLLAPIKEKNAQVVYGSRNLNEINTSRSPLFYFGGKAITSITNLLYNTNITDEPCGYKLFKTSLLKDIQINEDRFGWEPEITAKIAKKGIKIHEVAVNSSSRDLKHGKKLRRRDGLRALWILLKYRFLS